MTRVIGAYPAVTPTLPLQCPPGKHPVCGEVGCRVACQGRGSCVMRNTGGVTYPAGGLIRRRHKQSPDQYCSLGIANWLCLKLWQQPDRNSTWNWVGIGLKLGLSKQRNLVWKELCLSDFQIPSSCRGRFLSCGVVWPVLGSGPLYAGSPLWWGFPHSLGMWTSCGRNDDIVKSVRVVVEERYQYKWSMVYMVTFVGDFWKWWGRPRHWKACWWVTLESKVPTLILFSMDY